MTAVRSNRSNDKSKEEKGAVKFSCSKKSLCHGNRNEENYHMRCCVTKVTKWGNRMKIIHEEEEEIKESKERKGRK